MEIAALSAVLIAPAQALPPAVPTADALTTERFNAVMNGPDSAGVTGVQSMLQSSFPIAPLDTAPTLGGQILSGLRSVTTDFSAKWQGISTGLENMGAQPAISEMLRLQSQLLQVSVQYELVGKAVSRSTQNIDTLVRMS